MKALKMTWVLMALVASFNVNAGSLGQQDGKVKCTESVQSGRSEGGEVKVEDYTSSSSKDEGNGTER